MSDLGCRCHGGHLEVDRSRLLTITAVYKPCNRSTVCSMGDVARLFLLVAVAAALAGRSGVLPPAPLLRHAAQVCLEHIGSDTVPAAAPPHVFCRVVDVYLHMSVSVCARVADGATDEVYARVSLLPEDEEAERHARAREDEDAARDGEGGGAIGWARRWAHWAAAPRSAAVSPGGDSTMTSLEETTCEEVPWEISSVLNEVCWRHLPIRR
ncbi:hypothetical protein C2845_PM07G39850 [Panicum miliaceum]|uniref:Uncharacterized protein n=1 Tax=Panicum miliaceum TaxID=4540 RepID=A0A3L6SSN0_PANMI|nr:hypothetical protein C2845_PM07G39850 [Panicum miliaceum]